MLIERKKLRFFLEINIKAKEEFQWFPFTNGEENRLVSYVPIGRKKLHLQEFFVLARIGAELQTDATFHVSDDDDCRR